MSITIIIASTERVGGGKTRVKQVAVATLADVDHVADWLGDGKLRGDPDAIRAAMRDGTLYRGCQFTHTIPHNARKTAAARGCRIVTVVGLGVFPSVRAAARQLMVSEQTVRQAIKHDYRVGAGKHRIIDGGDL